MTGGKVEFTALVETNSTFGDAELAELDPEGALEELKALGARRHSGRRFKVTVEEIPL